MFAEKTEEDRGFATLGSNKFKKKKEQDFFVCLLLLSFQLNLSVVGTQRFFRFCYFQRVSDRTLD
jgi:hypothetical protein